MLFPCWVLFCSNFCVLVNVDSFVVKFAVCFGIFGLFCSKFYLFCGDISLCDVFVVVV